MATRTMPVDCAKSATNCIPASAARVHSTISHLTRPSRSYTPRCIPAANRAPSAIASTTLGAAERDASSDQHPVYLPPASPAISELGWARGLDSQYTLGSFLGAGSYGVIHTATSVANGATVAIKCLAKERPNAPRARTLKRIAREAALMERLRGCPSVVQLVDKFEEPDAVYFVMELAAGKDLSVLLQERTTLPEHMAARIVYECLHVLRACHNAHVVHADIKPNNLLVDLETLEGPCAGGWEGPCAPERPLVKLLDFGCSQAFLPGKPLSRRTGTPIYMAPEVYRKSYTPAADVWSLGVMLFQIITGQFPFWPSMRACLDSSIDEVMSSILTKPLHVAHLYDAGASRECIDLVMSMLDRDVRRRITVEEALQHPWLAMHAAPRDCGCDDTPTPGANNIVKFAGAPQAMAAKVASPEEVGHHASALGIWAMMQSAVRGQPSVM